MSVFNIANSESIGVKIRKLIIVVSVSVLLIALSISMIANYYSNRASLVEEGALLADLMAANVQAALTFDDPKAAAAILGTLSVEKGIVGAFLHKSDGEVFASYVHSTNDGHHHHPYDKAWRESSIENNGRAYRFVVDHLDYVVPIYLNDEAIGSVHIELSVDQLNQQVLADLLVAALLLLISVTAIFWLSAKLHQKISGPILELVATMDKVTNNKDYSVHIEKQSGDEVGLLVDGFNHMIGQISKRDQQLVEYNAGLEQEIELRTRDLLAAKEAAEAASRAKSEFLATMSHEIRTPMNGVLGMTELLMESQLDTRQLRLATSAYNAGQALLAIINDILDFSKIEAGKFSLMLQEFSLRNLVTEAVEMLEGLAFDKSLNMHCSVSDDVPAMVCGDVDRVRQILVNLLGNAIKFTEQGYVSLSLQLACTQGNMAKVVFEVRDTGPGIALEDQENIFHQFTQVDSSTTRRFGGTGLGLAISSQLVGLMGGQLTVDSQPGAGACFSFSLALEIVQRELVEVPESKVSTLEPTPEQSTTQKPISGSILLAEDSEMNQVLVLDIFEDFDVQIDIAQNGKEAVQAVSEKNYDVILMDFHMPEMDGLEATRQIRQMELNDGKGMHVPIIALTADVQKDVLGKCQEAGMDDYLSKPFKPKELISKLIALGNR